MAERFGLTAHSSTAGERLPGRDFGWDGAQRVRVCCDAPGLATEPGWRDFFRVRCEFNQHTVASILLAAVVTTVFDPLVDEILLAALLLGFAARWLERTWLSASGSLMYELAWDETGLTLDERGDVRFVPAEDVRAVVCREVPWYGRLSGEPLSLGCEVVVPLSDGSEVFVGRGLSHRVGRLLAERLSRDLGAPMIESGELPIVREAHALDVPLVRQPPKRSQWRRLPSHSAWRLAQPRGGFELTIGGRGGLGLAWAAVLEHSGSALMWVLLFDLIRFPVVLWIGLLNLAGLALPARPLFDWDGLDALLHLLACLPLAWGVWRAQRLQRLRLDGGQLVYEVGGRRVGALRLERIERVRREHFPTSAVRVIADGRELLVEDLPGEVDYDALADQLPALLRTAAPHLDEAGEAEAL